MAEAKDDSKILNKIRQRTGRSASVSGDFASDSATVQANFLQSSKCQCKETKFTRTLFVLPFLKFSLFNFQVLVVLNLYPAATKLMAFLICPVDIVHINWLRAFQGRTLCLILDFPELR